MTLSGLRGYAVSGAIAFLCACGGSSAQTPPSETPEPASAWAPETGSSGSLEGDYACHLTIGGQEYRDATCVIGPGDLPDSLWLEKRQGSQRLSGEVVPADGGGFEFHGYYFCPQGACDEDVDAVFEQTEPGTYRGTIETSQGEVVVTLIRE